jgi:hypothetical protein
MYRNVILFFLLLILGNRVFGQLPRPFGVWREITEKRLEGEEFDGYNVYGQIQGLDSLIEPIQSRYDIDSILYLERVGTGAPPYVFFIDNWENSYNLKIERCKGLDCRDPELLFYRRKVKGVYNKKNKKYHLKIFQKDNDLFLGECSDYLIVTIEQTINTENTNTEDSFNGIVSTTSVIKQFYVYLCF